jgi:DNA-binding winged helix-turn-helix (wHTH) protein
MNANARVIRERAAAFRFDEFTFDWGSRQLFSNGVERHLSPKAQHLLHLLLAAQPDALSREELYDALWPSTFVCETNLASIVNEVRRTLGDDAHASHYIRTVHGFGYAFCGRVASSIPFGCEAAMLLWEGRSDQLCEGENTVGRALDGRVVITAPTVSRYHAVITINNGVFSIEDLGSKNGTYVDGVRIGGAPTIIKPGAQLAFGAVVASINCRRLSSTKSLQLNIDDLRRRVAERSTRADPRVHERSSHE